MLVYLLFQLWWPNWLQFEERCKPIKLKKEKHMPKCLRNFFSNGWENVLKLHCEHTFSSRCINFSVQSMMKSLSAAQMFYALCYPFIVSYIKVYLFWYFFLFCCSAWELFYNFVLLWKYFFYCNINHTFIISNVLLRNCFYQYFDFTSLFSVISL